MIFIFKHFKNIVLELLQQLYVLARGRGRAQQPPTRGRGVPWQNQQAPGRGR